MVEIEKTPHRLYVEPPQPGELYPKLVLEMELITRFPKDYLVLDSDAKIILTKERDTGSKFEILGKPYMKYIKVSDSSIRFYSPLTKKLFQSIETFRAGENLKYYFKMDKFYVLEYEIVGDFSPVGQNCTTSIQNGKILPNVLLNLKYDIGGCRGFPQGTITREEWSENVLKPLNIDDRFILEIPCKLPDITTLDVDETELNELKNRVEKGIKLLQETIDEYQIKKDVNKCIDDMRRLTDNLHRFPNRNRPFDLYGKYLMEKSATASHNISKDLIEQIFNIIDSLYGISSKSPHLTSQQGEQIEYYPNYEDADMLLGITSLIYYFLSKKFERMSVATSSLS